eukprot:8283853-Karenia_brevis.AAC.1
MVVLGRQALGLRTQCVTKDVANYVARTALVRSAWYLTLKRTLCGVHDAGHYQPCGAHSAKIFHI